MTDYEMAICYYLDRSTRSILTCRRCQAREILSEYKAINPAADVVLLSEGEHIPVLGVDY